MLLLRALCVSLDLVAPQAGSKFTPAEWCLGQHLPSGSAQGSSPSCEPSKVGVN